MIRPRAACRHAVIVIAAMLASGAGAAPSQTPASSVELANYEWVATYALPPRDTSTNPATLNAHEASAVTYDWDTDTLLVVGDEGGNIVEVSLSGEVLGKMAILGFADPEGLTYVGNGEVVLVEESNRDAYRFTFARNTFVFRNTLVKVDLGTPVDNIGIEGISYDPVSGDFVTVKEMSPQEVNLDSVDFTSGSATITALFDPASLGVGDLADVQALATVPTLVDDGDNLLLLSQESSVLLETDRQGNVLGSFDLSALANTAEGVTIDRNGNLYVVAENGLQPQLFVLSPKASAGTASVQVPATPWWALLLGALLLVGQGSARRRRVQPCWRRDTRPAQRLMRHELS